MQASSSISERDQTPTTPATQCETSRLRTVTGNPFPRKCACGCDGPIPRDPQLRYVVDFSGPKPFTTCLCEHSRDFGPRVGQLGQAIALIVPCSVVASAQV